MQLRYTQDALVDLLEISEFIARDNPTRALSFVDEMKRHCKNLSNMALSSPIVKELGTDVHRSVFGNYNIYYLVGRDTMVIFGVIEGHRRQAHALKDRQVE